MSPSDAGQAVDDVSGDELAALLDAEVAGLGNLIDEVAGKA